MEHYFTAKSTTDQVTKKIVHKVCGHEISFLSSNAVFSKNQIDFGSNLLLETMIGLPERFSGTMLDVGCGYGTLGVTLAKVYPELQVDMVDVNERALELALKNAKENGVRERVNGWLSDVLSEVPLSYDTIVTNPPIRAGKAVVHAIYHQAYDHLNPGGKLFVVIQKKQGAPSSAAAIESLFGNCKTLNRQGGYHILCAVKA